MGFSRLLLVIGITAIPLWYVYRTVEEKRVRRLEWSEVFMTEPDRQKKWAEEKQKAIEAAEAERIQKATELEKATAARKVAEVEAAKAAVEVEKAKAETAHAQTEALRQRNAEAAEESRRKAEQERRAVEAATSHAKVEADRASERDLRASALKTCEDKAKSASASRQKLISEQNNYRAFIDQISLVSLPEPPSEKFFNQTNLAALERVVFGSEYTKTFRMLFAREELATGALDSVKQAKDDCVSRVAGGITDLRDMYLSFGAIELLGSTYEKAVDGLRRSRADISDLVDYATGKLTSTLGADVRRERVKEIISRAKGWRESQ